MEIRGYIDFVTEKVDQLTAVKDGFNDEILKLKNKIESIDLEIEKFHNLSDFIYFSEPLLTAAGKSIAISNQYDNRQS